MRSCGTSAVAGTSRDIESRNGTFVNDRKIDDSVLAEGHYLKVGSTEFQFHQSRLRPTLPGDPDVGITQSIVAPHSRWAAIEFDAARARHDPHRRADARPAAAASVEHQAAGAQRYADRAFARRSNLLQGRTKASVVGFLVGQRRSSICGRRSCCRSTPSNDVRLERRADAARLRRRARRLDRQPSIGRSREGAGALLRRAVRAAGARQAACSARFISISSTAGFANRISISPCRSRTSRPRRWPARCTKKR